MSRCYVPRDAHRRVPEVSSVASLQIITVSHGVTVYIIIAGAFLVLPALLSRAQRTPYNLVYVKYNKFCVVDYVYVAGVPEESSCVAAGHFLTSHCCYLPYSGDFTLLIS